VAVDGREQVPVGELPYLKRAAALEKSVGRDEGAQGERAEQHERGAPSRKRYEELS
jgi:hypothetical protein